MSTPAAPQSTPPGSEASDQPSAPPVDDERCPSAADRRVPAAVDGVELEEVRAGLRAALHLVDVDELEVLALPAGAQGEATHPTEAVDPDAYRRAHATSAGRLTASSVARWSRALCRSE